MEDIEASTAKEEIFFREARQLFEEMVDWLSSQSACGLEHGELEENLFGNGNELLKGGIPLLKGVSHSHCSITPPPVSMVV